MSVVEQYRPISTDETGADDGYSPRILRDHADNIGNAVVYALAHPVLAIPCFPLWYSHDNTTDERVVAMLAPVHVPQPYTKFAWTVCHEMTAEDDGDSTVTWRLYTSEWRYYGDGTMDVTKLSANYDVDSIVSTELTADETPAPGTVDVQRSGGMCHFVLTAQNSDTPSTRGCIKSITIWPVWA
jgi:hypothetical protein